MLCIDSLYDIRKIHAGEMTECSLGFAKQNASSIIGGINTSSLQNNIAWSLEGEGRRLGPIVLPGVYPV